MGLSGLARPEAIREALIPAISTMTSKILTALYRPLCFFIRVSPKYLFWILTIVSYHRGQW